VQQYGISWWAAESKSIELRVPSNAGNVFSSSENISRLKENCLMEFLNSAAFETLRQTTFLVFEYKSDCTIGYNQNLKKKNFYLNTLRTGDADLRF
jgi:hypothetical protein